LVFAEFAQTAQAWAGENLPFLVGGGVAVVVLTVVFFTTRTQKPPEPKKDMPSSSHIPLGEANPLAAEKSTNWAPPEQAYGDRRGAVRREGQPVRVLLASPTFRNGVSDGYVLDRSTGGLKIAMQAAIAPGTSLQVRASNAPDTIGFVTVIVRSCRQNGEFYEVGCEFEKTPPWNVLLLFG
jgi:hypothetical protein